MEYVKAELGCSNMRMNYIIITMLFAFMLVLSANLVHAQQQSPSCSTSSSSTTCSATETLQLPFGASSAQQLAPSPLSTPQQTPYPLSPALNVYQYNANNALYLLTCPYPPELPNPTDAQLISTSTPGSPGNWHPAGNLCQEASNPNPQAPQVILSDSVTLPSDPTQQPSSSDVAVNVNLQNVAQFTLTNLGYSPMVTTPYGNYISTSFNTNSYIFDEAPVYGQQGLWTWNGLYADAGALGSNYNGQLRVTSTASGTYTPTASSCAQPNPLSSNPSFPDAFFAEALSAAGDPVTTTNIDFLEALAVAEAQTSGGTYFKGWNPLEIQVSSTTYPNPCSTYTYFPASGASIQQYSINGGASTGTSISYNIYSSSADGVSTISDLLTGGDLTGSSPTNQGQVADIGSDLVSGASFSTLVNDLQTVMMYSSSAQSDLPGVTPAVITQMQTWATTYQPDALHTYLLSQFQQNAPGGGLQVPSATCSYPYTVTSTATLDSIGSAQIPFPIGSGMNLDILPYFVYNANVINPTVGDSLSLSYDIYSPQNYKTPQNVIEPFTINSMGFFLSNYAPSSGSSSLSYFNLLSNPPRLAGNPAQVDFQNPQQQIGLEFAGSSEGASTTTSSTSSSNAQMIWDALISAGFSQVEAAGIMGNAAQETGGQSYENINVEENTGSNCFGMVCFTTGGGYTESSLVTGNEQADLTAQIQTIISRLGSTSFYSGTDPTQAAIAFMQDFEKCNGYNTPNVGGTGMYGECNAPVREAQAQAAYSALSGSQVQGSSISSTSSYLTTQILNPTSIASIPSGYTFVLGQSPQASQSSSSQDNCLPSPGQTTITEYQFFQDVLCKMEVNGGNEQASIYFLALWAYYQNNNWGNQYFSGYQGDPLLSSGATAFYDPLYIGSGPWQTTQPNPLFSGNKPTAFNNAKDGILGTVGSISVGQQSSDIYLVLQNKQQSGACSGEYILCLLNSPSDYINDFSAWGTCNYIGVNPPECINSNNNIQFFNDLKELGKSCSSSSGCQLPNDVAGTYIKQWLNYPVPVGPASSSQSQSQSLTPQEQQYQSAISYPGINLYILKQIPSGYYNTSLYPPNTVPSASSQSAFTQNWNTYWNNVQKLQSQNLYIVNAIPISFSYPILSQIQNYEPGATFTPVNVTSDLFGDVFITGYVSSSGQPNNYWLVKIANAVGGGPISISAAPICNLLGLTQYPGAAPPGNCAIHSYFYDFIQSQDSSPPWPEIAASPYGDQVYLAAPGSGNILEFSGADLAYESQIGLSFTSDNVLYSTPSFTNPTVQGSQQAGSTESPAANIIDYFANGGLYGINANCKSSSTAADCMMKAIIQNYDEELSSEASNLQGSGESISQDQLDKQSYHHPLGIADVNGYLYVLDDWYGVAGEPCVNGLFGCNSGPGIRFNILDLRVINTSGIDVPINPTYYNDLWYYTGNSHTSLARYTQSSPFGYPPFGWIISANITSGADTQEIINLCNPNTLEVAQGFSTTRQAGFSSSTPCYPPDPTYSGSLSPIGPEILSWSCYDTLEYHHSCGPVPLIDTGFSVSYNNTASLYIRSRYDIQNNGGSSIQYANGYGELITASLNPQNYTKQIGGPNPSQVTYSCYTYDKYSSGTCAYNPNVENLMPPVYLLPNPFQFDENIGGYQAYTLDTLAGSGLAGLGGGSGSGSGSSSSCTPQDIENSGSGNGGNGNCASVISNAAQSLLSQFQSSAPSTLNINYQPQTLPPLGTELQSILSGYIVFPYSYTYAETFKVQYQKPSLLSLCTGPAPQNQQSTSTQTVYTYATTPQINSNQQVAQINGGDAYAQSEINTSQYYEANLSTVILPSQLLYSILSNRQFGTIYINSTTSAQTNSQLPINAINFYTYGSDTYVQGKLPGYETISVQNMPYACTGVSCIPPELAKSNPSYPVNDLFSATPTNKLYIALFNWFKYPTSAISLNLLMTGRDPAALPNFQAFGYHRLVFVYDDQFNNIVYMPLDVDISNITQITNFNVVPSVNTLNTNETTLYANGIVSWTPPLSTTPIPLTSGNVYLYYDTNLNTMGYNAVEDPVDAQSCAFNSIRSSSDSGCTLANPIIAGLQYNPNYLFPDGSPSITPNVITYNPSYNGMNTCSPPANSLLAPITQSYTLCNINNMGPGQNPPAQCPATAQGLTQYCYPFTSNGLGICTSQLGLFAIAPVYPGGQFGANVVACGTGYAKITAVYYGTPPTQPIQAKQSPISEAANPSSFQSVTFNAFSYTWSPTETGTTVPIGSILLSIGNFDALIMLLLGISIIALSLVFKGRLYKRAKSRAERRRAKG